MMKINKWEEEYIPKLSRNKNGNVYTNVMECINKDEFEHVYINRLFSPFCPSAVYAIKNIGKSNIKDEEDANDYVEDPKYNIIMIVYGYKNMPTLFYEYTHVTANKGIGRYCFYEDKRKKAIDLKNFPYKTEEDELHLDALDSIILNYSGKNCRLYMTENPDMPYPGPKDTIYESDLVDIYKDEYKKVIKIAEKYLEYSYAYDYIEVREIFLNDDLEGFIKLFPDTSKYINGLPLISYAVDTGADKIVEYCEKKGFNPNENDMAYHINVFHHAIICEKSREKALEYVKRFYNSNVDINNPDINGETCIVDVIKYNDNAIFDFLYSKKELDLSIYTNYFYNCYYTLRVNLLYQAISSRNVYALRKLLERIDVNEKDEDCVDILTFAILCSNRRYDEVFEEILELLLEHGVDIPEEIDFANMENYEELYEECQLPEKIINLLEEKRNE